MVEKKFLYPLYKRLRPSVGMAFGFIMMYAMFTTGLTYTLLTIAIGFFLISLFGDFYNDYWDYDEDMRNGKKDKFTTLGILTSEQSKHISFMLVAPGLVLILSVNVFIFLVGFLYALLLFFYSHPSVRLKGDVKGYSTLASVYFILPFGLLVIVGGSFSMLAVLFAFFWFFQFVYLLCQKDSTDSEDDKNLFKDHGWKKSSIITALFGALSSLSLLMISIISLYFLLVWILNLCAKIFNINKIIKKTITRTQRHRMILLEFLTPYLYLVGGMIA